MEKNRLFTIDQKQVQGLLEKFRDLKTHEVDLTLDVSCEPSFAENFTCLICHKIAWQPKACLDCE